MVSTQLKIVVNLEISSPNRGENKKYLKPPPSYSSTIVFFNVYIVDSAGCAQDLAWGFSSLNKLESLGDYYWEGPNIHQFELAYV